MTFGKPLRAGTPVKGIINGDYGNEAEKSQTAHYEEAAARKLLKKFTGNVISSTKAHELASKMAHDKIRGSVDKKQFRLKRFENVQPKVQMTRMAKAGLEVVQADK